MGPMTQNGQKHPIHPHINPLVWALELQGTSFPDVVQSGLNLLVNKCEGVAAGRTNRPSVCAQSRNAGVVRRERAHWNHALFFSKNGFDAGVVVGKEVGFNRIDVKIPWHRPSAEHG